ncbi:DUF2804 domain-containing protein [Stackebrandtia soli]|uniref:DUF2804 domain-containing protein n=1 Tax=Stackebrandtia soli TaxID=1892856 RepID=UPI0039EA0F4F
MTTRERELIEPVDLCLPNGWLNPAAIGWSRRPLHRANLRGWGRVKRWEYWGIVTPTHIVGIVASSLDYAGLHGVYVLDRLTGTEVVKKDVVVPLARGTAQPERSGAGRVVARGGGVEIVIDQDAAGTSIVATAPGVDIGLDVPLPDGWESLGVVIPWGPRRFQLTVKDVGRPVSGTLRLNDEEFTVSADDSFAVLDHGRGKWPYSVTWNWAAASKPGGPSLQFGGKWTDGTGYTENAIVVDGRLHKIGEELVWEYDRAEWTRPWRIHGERVDVTLEPFHEKVSRTNLGVVANETHQCFGEFNGRVRTDDGVWVDVAGLTGWAEEASNRW